MMPVENAMLIGLAVVAVAILILAAIVGTYLTLYDTCPHCRGFGDMPEGFGGAACPHCQGSGHVWSPMWAPYEKQVLPAWMTHTPTSDGEARKHGCPEGD